MRGKLPSAAVRASEPLEAAWLSSSNVGVLAPSVAELRLSDRIERRAGLHRGAVAIGTRGMRPLQRRVRQRRSR
jgi:hypothetical protein